MKNENTRKTLKDIAAEAKLSVATVSQILNDKPCNFSSEKTKRKVKSIAHQMGYRPNIGYKIMMGHKTQTVGIIIGFSNTRSDEHIQKLILHLNEILLKNGYASYVCTLSLNENENISTIEDLIHRGVEHFVMLGSPRGIEKIQVLFHRYDKTYIGFNSVLDRNLNFDIVSAVKAILEFFLNEGRTNFKMVLLDQGKSTFLEDRFIALKNILQGRDNEELWNKYIYPIPYSYETTIEFEEYAFLKGYEATREIMQKDFFVQAIFYTNDNFAIGGVKYLVENDYKIGKDIAVAGFNNIHAVRYNPFPVSSVEHNIDHISKVLLEELFKKTPFLALEKPEIHIRK
ncbi:MAG: LacI family DNA-binding transcriptional regulator [Victivallales bacterium]